MNRRISGRALSGACALLAVTGGVTAPAGPAASPPPASAPAGLIPAARAAEPQPSSFSGPTPPLVPPVATVVPGLVNTAFDLATRGPVARVLPGPHDTPTCYYGACFDYVVGQQFVTGAGMSVLTTVADPQVNPNFTDAHSLQEIAVQNTTQTATVELGWTVDKAIDGDLLPHVFVYHWVNGQQSCYNGCGFVREGTAYQAGSVLKPGSVISLRIEQYQGTWLLMVDGAKIGYFPDSLWQNSFTVGQLDSVFGEVSMDPKDVPTCTQMGDGRMGSVKSASTVSQYTLYGSTGKPSIAVRNTSPGFYDQGSVTPTSFSLGGPGSGGKCHT